MRDGDGCLVNQENLVRGMLKTFPYSESQLLQQMVMQLAKTPIVSNGCLSVCLSVYPSVRPSVRLAKTPIVSVLGRSPLRALSLDFQY